MGNFSNNAITDVGRMLLADVQAGAVFVPTRIVMGSGNMPGGATAQGMTDVLTPVISLAINKKKRTPDGKCVFGGVYTNEDITEPFYFRELALYAKAVTYNADGSVKSESAETLYSYGNAGATADFMPAYSTSTVVEKQMDLVIWVGNETQVDLTIESAIFVTQREFSSHAARHAIGGEDPITPASIGAVKNSGDTMTGDLVINKAFSTIKLKAPQGETLLYKNADAASDYGTTISDQLSNGTIDRFNLSASRPLAEKLRLVVNGGDSYNILHTGNKNLIAPADIGAVKKSGDTMTGDLTIRKSLGPSVQFLADNGASAAIQLWNNSLTLSNKNIANDSNNYRLLAIQSALAESRIEYALGFSDVKDGQSTYYAVLHTGNLATFGLGLLPASVE